MLGLADRARIIDLFEFVMKGDVQAALIELKYQYDSGADPATVLSDLAGFVHYVTKVRFVPEAADDKTLSEQERMRGKEFAEKLSPRILGRAWQILLKGIGEVQTSERALAAADMVLVRLTHAADLPTPDEALRKLAGQPPQTKGVAQSGSDAGAIAGSAGNVTANGGGLPKPATMASNGAPTAHRKLEPVASATPETQPLQYEQIDTFDDLLAVAEKRREIGFKLALRNHIRLVSFARGKIEINTTGNPPRNLVNDISSKLQAWTGERWMVAASQQEGDLTRKEQEEETRKLLVADAKNTPAVAAVLATFPGSAIVDIRVRDTEQPLSDPSLEEESDGLDDFFE